MFASRHNGVISLCLLFAVFLWGGNNAGIKHLVKFWPPIWVGGTRFFCAGLLIFALMRWNNWMGKAGKVPADLKRLLWTRTGLALAIYIVAFNYAVSFTAASHVALYLGASPVWALLWEGVAGQSRKKLVIRYMAAALAMSGVVVLFWPNLKTPNSSIVGEILGILASVLWTFYGRQTRALGNRLSGAEITAHTMARAGVLMMPLALIEVYRTGLVLSPPLVGIQAYCIVAGGVVAFGLWNNALQHWKTSEVYLFNNLIPLSTMLWAHFTLGEPMTPTFWIAMVLIVAGVVIGQANELLLGLFRVKEVKSET